MIANTKISNLIKNQVPFFVKNDHANFVRFIEAYYEFLEQNDQAVNGIKTAKDNIDVDLTIDAFADKMYEHFMKTIPSTIIADKKLVMKNIKRYKAGIIQRITRSRPCLTPRATTTQVRTMTVVLQNNKLGKSVENCPKIAPTCAASRPSKLFCAALLT